MRRVAGFCCDPHEELHKEILRLIKMVPLRGNKLAFTVIIKISSNGRKSGKEILDKNVFDCLILSHKSVFGESAAHLAISIIN